MTTKDKPTSDFTFKNISYKFLNAKDSLDFKSPCLLTQIHSPNVLYLPKKRFDMPKADAWVSNKKGIPLTIKTADCAPVLLADEKAGIIGAAHAGWKGAFQGVIERTILAMISLGAELSDISAMVGPCLQKESFETDEKMKGLFPESDFQFFTPKGEGKYLFDFEAYVVSRLKACGISKIQASHVDTYTTPAYNSYRRDPLDPARQYSVIWINED